MTDISSGLGPAAWIAHWAAATPSAPALEADDGRVWNYAELARGVAGWADALRGDVATGGIVCISPAGEAERRLARWAVDWLGGVDAVLDPGLAERERDACLEVLRPCLILDALPSASPGGGQPLPGGGRILFTTGSSGVPKAVRLDNPALTAAAHANVRARRLRPDDRLLAVLPCHHAAGCLFEDSMLLLGACIRVARRDGAGWLVRALAEGGGTLTSVVPSMLRPLLAEPDCLDKLRLINYAGEAISRELLDQLLAVFPGEVTRGYGMTEAGPLIAVLDDASHRDGLNAPSLLGLPAPAVTVKVDDAGELLVRSPSLMSGYHNAPEATASVLVDGWLRTGDLAEIAPVTGMIRLVGRRCHLFRSGGKWVSPSEIEEILGTLPGVTDSVVLPLESPRWGNVPVALTEGGRTLTRDDLEAVFKTALSQHKWPVWVELMDEFPRHGNGKTDRGALGRLVLGGPSAAAFVIRDLTHAYGGNHMKVQPQ